MAEWSNETWHDALMQQDDNYRKKHSDSPRNSGGGGGKFIRTIVVWGVIIYLINMFLTS